MAWPEKIKTATERNFTIAMIYEGRRKFLEEPEKACQFNDGERWVCGYVLPSFQRQHVWEQERAIGFIENLILGHHPGHWQYNNAMDFGTTRLSDGREVWKFDRWLLDGQQRFCALDSYWSDEFPVFGSYWSEVPERDSRRLFNTAFSASEHRLNDYDELCELYWRINRGGIPHTDAEMQLLAMSGLGR